MLDGYIARKYHAESVLGARLDTMGDFVFYTVLTSYLIVEQNDVFHPFLISVLIILMLRMGNIVIGFLKYHKLIMIHTIANKVTGGLVFTLPLTAVFGAHLLVLLTVIAALISSIEESMIILLSPSKEIDLNKKSIFR